jgi:hypothetical protein
MIMIMQVHFHEGLARVKLNGKAGFIDKTGKEIVPPKYDDDACTGFQRRFGSGELNRKWGLIDKTGKEIVPPKYDIAGDFQEGLAPIMTQWQTGLY